MKKLFLLLLVPLFLASCDMNPTVDQNLAKQQEVMMKEAAAQTGMPAIKNFQERKMMKMIMELRDQENVHTYCYLFSEVTGKLIYIWEAIGYGLPYATQYTSPERIAKYSETEERGNITLPQADPNGLFMPQSAAWTWVMLIDPDTKEPRPVYLEPNVILSPFKLQ